MALEMPAVLAAITGNLGQQTIFPSFITANFMAICLHVLVKSCKSGKFLILSMAVGGNKTQKRGWIQEKICKRLQNEVQFFLFPLTSKPWSLLFSF